MFENYVLRFFCRALAVLGLICFSSLPAYAVNLDFTELPNQPVDGVSIMGVTFDFKVGGFDSPDARYNSLGPGNLTYVMDPSLEGNNVGILTLDFSGPTSTLNFGLAMSYTQSLSPGFTVELFDNSYMSLGVTPVATDPLISFTEAQFTYSGTPVRRAVIDFNESLGTARFALDNLQYEIIPEPATCWLAVAGIVGLGAWRWRRQSS